ncbi:uncharacterized protein B0J16DRAFT_81196 [Fusarium flagelliforme]|uniref:uncharacterized protein n=1 Tax=Fusarium flagelliforme TaxID=2675880 RepID=UPI001E8CA1F8|nr:uncharacterized protein B0J16DRAFT_81196 [Fusarium flagelliforme]KAH7193519.1 hypothetical protein B0J16DRAFT_81196 [Fusarium flagelliforme]
MCCVFAFSFSFTYLYCVRTAQPSSITVQYCTANSLQERVIHVTPSSAYSLRRLQHEYTLIKRGCHGPQIA